MVDRLAHEVVRRRLTQPAQVALEVCGPLNFLSSQSLQFFQPLIASFGDAHAYDAFAAFLEQRGSVEYIHDRIDLIEREFAAKEHPGAS